MRTQGFDLHGELGTFVDEVEDFLARGLQLFGYPADACVLGLELCRRIKYRGQHLFSYCNTSWHLLEFGSTAVDTAAVEAVAVATCTI